MGRVLRTACFLLYPFMESGSKLPFHTLSLMFVLLANWKPGGVLPHTRDLCMGPMYGSVGKLTMSHLLLRSLLVGSRLLTTRREKSYSS